MILMFRIVGAGNGTRNEVVHAADVVQQAPIPRVGDIIPVAYWDQSEPRRSAFRVTKSEWEIDLIDLVNPENVRYVLTLEPVETAG